MRLMPKHICTLMSAPGNRSFSLISAFGHDASPVSSGPLTHSTLAVSRQDRIVAQTQTLLHTRTHMYKCTTYLSVGK